MKTDDSKGGTIFLLRDILIHELGLDENRIQIWNQKLNIPPDEKLFVALSYMMGKVYHSKAAERALDDGSMVEDQLANVQEMIDVNVMSRGTEALFRKEEVVMALASKYSQQVQAAHGFRIASLPNAFRDNSEIEASARMTRFTFTLVIFAWYKKTTAIEHYDTFKVEVDTEKAADHVEFEQDGPIEGD